MSVNVGTIQYLIDIDTKTLTGKLSAVDQQVTKTSEATAKSGSKMGSAFSKAVGPSKVLLGATAAVGAAAVAAFGAFVIKGGITRALNIEDAQAKLKGLGHSTKAVEGIMDSALKSVKGTAFGLDAAAGAAASAVAAGIKPGKDLTRTLTVMGDAATIAGTDFDSMAGIFNKVASTGKLQGDVIRQLGAAGIPILQLVGKEIGKSAEEVSKMASEGKIDFKTFQKAMEAGLGGAALKSGNTFRGAMANAGAAMARVGAAIVEDILPKIHEGITSLTKWFDDNSDKLVKIAGDVADGLKSMGKTIKKVWDKFPDGSQVWILAGALLGGLTPALISVAAAAWLAVAPLLPFIAAGAALGAVAAVIYKNWDKISPVWESLKTKLDTLKDAFKSVQEWIIKHQDGLKQIATVIAVIIGPAFIQLAAQAVVAAATSASAWLSVGITMIGQAVASGAAWLLQFGIMTAKAIASAVIFAAQAIIAGWAWIAQAGAAAVAWTAQFLIMTAKAAATAVIFVAQALIAGSAWVAQAAKASAAWVASCATTTTAVTALKAIIASPVAMGAIVVVAALASIAMVYKAVQSVIGLIAAMNSAADANARADSQAFSNYAKGKKMMGSSDPAKQAAGKKLIKDTSRLNSYASGTNFAPGGLALVGEKGPELVDLPRGSKVFTNSETRGMMASLGGFDGSSFSGGGDTEINIGTINLGDDVDVDSFFNRLTRDTEIFEKGLVPKRNFA